MFDLAGLAGALWAWLAGDVPVVGLALCRIGVAAALLVDVALLARDAGVWLHPTTGVIPADGNDYPRTWLFRVLGRVVPSARVSAAALAVQATLAVLVLVGAGSQLACAALFLTTSALHHRNPHILYGGDGLARVLLLLLACSPSGASLSVDAYLATGGLAVDAVAAPWGMRLIQVELCVLYLYNFALKAGMPAWREGVALYFVWRNPDLTNVPVPAVLRTVLASKLATWGTLALELVLAGGLLFEPTRPWCLALAVAFHAAIAITLSVHLFSYLMLAALGVFASPHAIGVAAAPTALGWAGAGACVAYLGYVVFWDPPAGQASPVSRAVRKLVRALPRWAPLHRSWRLFVGDPPGAQQLRLRIGVVRPNTGLERLTWSPRRGLYTPGDSDAPMPHRLRKFIAALSSFPRARELFGEYVMQRVGEADAVLIDVVCDPVPPPASYDREFQHLWDGARPLFTRVVPRADADPEALYVRVADQLGDTACDGSFVSTLLMLAMQRVLEGRDDTPYLARIETMWPRALGAVHPDDIRDLRCLCASLPTADPYAALIDGLEDEELKWAASERLGWVESDRFADAGQLELLHPQGGHHDRGRVARAG